MSRIMAGLLTGIFGLGSLGAQAKKPLAPAKVHVAPEKEHKEGDKAGRWSNGDKTFVDESLLGGTGLTYLGPVVWRNGAWVDDEEAIAAEKAEREKEKAHEQHLAELWTNLRTQVISDEDMKEVLEIGANLVPERDGGVSQLNGTFYGDYQTIMQQRKAAAEVVFQNALLNQFKMREFAKHGFPTNGK